MAAVIVNFRTPDLVLASLEALAVERGQGPSLRACVVDNGSGDGSLERLRAGLEDRGFDAWVDLIDAGRNSGFSGGNNLGLRALSARYYWLVNSDAQVRPGALRELVGALEARAGAGLVGPRLEWPDGTPQESCFRFRTPLTELVAAARTGPVSSLLASHVGALPVQDAPLDVDWLSFACVLIRREVLEDVGPLDEAYFLYFEDMDFCWRARHAGWGVLHWPAARAVHLRGQSGPVKRDTALRRRRPRYYYESRARVLATLWGRSGLWAANLLWHVGRTISWLRETLGSKTPHTCEREPFDIWTSALHPLTPRTGSSAAEATRDRRIG